MAERAALPSVLRSRPLTHRGLHDAAQGIAENSQAAFEAAIMGGYGIEMDIQMAADGEAMVFHDHDLGRLTGRRGTLRDLSSAVLRRTRLNHSADCMPTLAEVLRLVAGRAPLLIEIKDQDGALGARVGPLEARVAEVLRPYQGAVAVMSFNPNAVAAFAALAPRVPVGLTTCDFAPEHWPLVPPARLEQLAAMRGLDGLGASFISHDVHDLASPAVARAKAGGLAVLCWTIRTPEQEAKARIHADNITFEAYAAAR